MAISHVIRGEEWISSAPRHLLLYQALGYHPPALAHLPMILGPDRSKLSKRHGAVSITEYRNQGYLAEAMVNFLSLLGWSLDDRTELMSPELIIRSFTLDRVSRTAAIFNVEKLDWMNGVYLRELSLADFTDRALPFLQAGVPEAVNFDRSYLENALALLQERVKKLGEFRDQPELTRFFFIDNLEYSAEALVGKKMTPSASATALAAAVSKVAAVDEFSVENLETALRSLAEELGLKPGQLFGCLRIAVTGQSVSPPLFETMAVLGRQRTLHRLEKASAKAHAMAKA
jgi:glutamyl-tRNA synthetase